MRVPDHSGTFFMPEINNFDHSQNFQPMNENDPVYRTSVIDMFTVANEYCLFIEKAENYQVSDIIHYLSKVLPLMYLKGSLLTDVQVEYPEANERYVTEEQWQEIFNSLRHKFSDKDTFYHCDPGDSEGDILLLSFAENLADIYQDMKDFVLLYSKEFHAARENAVSEMFSLFGSHWGHRILLVLTHIHFLQHRRDMESLLNEDLI